MEDKKIMLSAADADKLIAAADGDAALLWLHIQRNRGLSLSAAARELKIGEARAAASADKLRAMGLLKVEKPLESQELPEYTAADIVVRANRDERFEGLVEAAQHALGRMLSTNDMRILFGIYDHLGLPADVIFLLINHCIERYRALHGEGRMPTMRFIEKEAWYWAGQEIMDCYSADEHIRREKERKSLVSRTAEALQIKGRELTPSERRYIESWLALGFGPETLAVAYDRTVLGTGKLAWKYMDKIVSSWHEKGLHSMEEIESGDARGRKKSEAATALSGDEELEEFRRMRAYLKNKEK